jgi:uncharacterized phage-like protein YoqJ
MNDKLSVALTGHRPERLGYPNVNDFIDEEWVRIMDWLKEKVKEEHITDAYCGMASGCDIAFGLACLELKDEDYPIALHCILPCKDYNQSDEWYSTLKLHADEWVELSDEFYKGCDNARDQYMVDHSDKLIAIWDGIKSGGVWSTIRKAQKRGIDIIYYPKDEL